MGVGSYDDALSSSALAEIWNGRSWRVGHAAIPEGATHVVVDGVSCNASTSCTAVGTATNRSGQQVGLSETWNGTSWAVRPTPDPSGAMQSQFVGVSCPSRKSCVAVGTSVLSDHVNEGFLERWDGQAWTLMKPARLQSAGSKFNGVSCSGVRYCVAVGMYLDSSSDDWVTLVEVWRGSGWIAQQTAQVTGSIVDELQGVTCMSKTRCTAVGYYINGNGVGHSLGATLAESWNGSDWIIEPTPSPAKGGGIGDLESVSCLSAMACTAVGYFDGNSHPDRTLAEVWNGSDWTLQPSVDPTATSSLSAVSCPVQTVCYAAGSYEAKFGPSLPLLEVHATTNWKQVQIPAVSGTASSTLRSVSCGAAGTCMAVGSYEVSPSTTVTLAENWNGARWLIVPTPQVDGSSTSTLDGVSCVSQHTCMAVGVRQTSSSSAGLVEEWNGKRWTIEQIGAPPGTSSAFSGVSCTSSQNCVAVGSYVLNSASFAFTETWDGSLWSIVAVPLPPKGYDSEFEGVSCTSPAVCTAVGEYTKSAMLAALVERWNGSQWTLQSTPKVDGYLAGISCPTTTTCTAVGNAYSYPSRISVLVEAWIGGKWLIQPTSPPVDSDFAQVYGVKCQSATKCSAVGAYFDAESGRTLTLAESRQESKWVIDATDNPDAQNVLAAVSARPAGGLVAIGSRASAGGISLTLAEGTNS
ncbi:MAG: hypothetical protein WAM97_17615 [Acidimicrobiales bacterium]